MNSAFCITYCLLLALQTTTPPALAPSASTSASPSPATSPQANGSADVSSLVAACKQPCLEDGTPVHLQLGQAVSSADAQVNDRVEFEVVDEVRVSDVVVINKGATAWGTVSEAQPKRRLARGGKLEIVMDSVQLTDGETTALRATKDAQGSGHRVIMTAGIVATGALFLPAAPVFLLMHGKNVTIPKGAEVPTFVNGNCELDPSKFQGFPTAAATPLPAKSAEISVTSNPPNADIQLDGAFVGNTPSMLMVSSGDHAIQIAKSGYRTWERKMSVTSGNVAIAADLEAATSETAAAAVTTNPPQQK